MHHATNTWRRGVLKISELLNWRERASVVKGPLSLGLRKLRHYSVEQNKLSCYGACGHGSEFFSNWEIGRAAASWTALRSVDRNLEGGVCWSLGAPAPLQFAI